ncbi:MAG: 50S ribosomal protein L9 [Spirochaetaceae bacterium]|jgi:large subunit ribosomal protein L9|nr:50S ribosomal protein L9 [Spirochaetaceae bacterium]
MAVVKIILNKDLATLGEEGDVKQVAKGFARNFLYPRNIAVPYNPATVALFEARRDEIEKRKEQKREDAGAVKARLEALELTLTMPAGAGGKLYGAVTSLTIADELEKQGFHIERKKIEVPGNGIKNVGKYKLTVKLYGAAQAEINVTVAAMEVKHEEAPLRDKKRHERHRPEETENAEQTPEAVTEAAPAAAEAESTD